MNNLAKTMIIGLAFSMTACNSDDSEPVKAPSNQFVEENNTTLIIPDGNTVTTPGVAENKISIAAEGTIADASKVSIKLDLQHTWPGDLVVQVFAPSGESCTLIKRIGTTTAGTDRDFLSGNIISFNSSAATTINDVVSTGTATNIPAGTYLPGAGIRIEPEAIVMTDLATFLNGKSVKGDWKIRIGDYSADDTGKLNNWKLEFETGALR